MKALILAGGSGTRLWPLSRKSFPKQFLKLNSDRSLLQQTVGRFAGILPPDDIIIMTNREHEFHVRADMALFSDNLRQSQDAKGAQGLKEIGPFHMILEPVGRNTAPAIALGLKYCTEKLGCSDDEVVFISPSDHIISPDSAFRASLKEAGDAAKKGYIVTFGIPPSRPETGYGYIKVKNVGRRTDGDSALEVIRFTEKPDRVTAEQYLKEGGYYWNSGMFAFSIGTMTEAFRKHEKDIAAMLSKDYDEMAGLFNRMPDISIDYAVMERSDRVVTVPVEFSWNDIGSWDSLFDVLEKDEKSNACEGDVIAVDTEKSLIIGDKRLIAAIGLEDCLVVDTPDALLITKRGHSQKVRDLTGLLTAGNRKEVSEHITTYRPWGNYTVLEEGERYKIKRIVVEPGHKLSLQKHLHRSEHWVVVKGTAKVTIDSREVVIHENESAFVPKETLHRLENPGKDPLEIIEVQNGSYVGEDDIVRIDDVYERHKK